VSAPKPSTFSGPKVDGIKGVQIGPGATALTRSRAGRDRPEVDDEVVQRGLDRGIVQERLGGFVGLDRGRHKDQPPSSSSPANAWASQKGEKTLVAKVRSIRSGGNSSKDPWDILESGIADEDVDPAQFRHRNEPLGDLRVVFSCGRWAMAISAPCAAYVTAIARPMPESAPVFSAHSGQSFATFQVRSP